MTIREKISISIPLGAFASIAIFLYMIVENIWNKLSIQLKILSVIGLILLFLFGSIDYEREEKL